MRAMVPSIHVIVLELNLDFSWSVLVAMASMKSSHASLFAIKACFVLSAAAVFIPFHCIKNSNKDFDEVSSLSLDRGLHL